MRADYLDHRALEDDIAMVYLVIRVPDGRILLQKNERKRLVPRLSGDWQCTLSKMLMRGQRNDAAMKTLIFTSFSWAEKMLEDVKLLIRFGLNRKTIFIYFLDMKETIMISPGAGAEFRALPWDHLVDTVLNKKMEFSDETHAVIDILHNHNGGRF